MEEDSGTTKRSPEAGALDDQRVLRSGGPESSEGHTIRPVSAQAPANGRNEHSPSQLDTTGLGRGLRQGLRQQLTGAENLVAIFSHEIRNPLASILAGLQTLERVGSLVPDDRFVLGLVIGEARSAVKIVDRFRDSVRQGIRSPTRIELGDLLAGVLAELNDLQERTRVSFVLVQAEPPLWVTVDRQALARAVKNLLQNALEACQNGDSVEVGWREMHADEIARVLPGFLGRVAVIYGEDPGPGLPPDLSLSSVFEPFVTGKPGRPGLGLPMAREIVESHSGAVRLQPTHRGGIRFEVLLPIGDPVPCWEARDQGTCPDKTCGILCDECDVKSAGIIRWCWMGKGRAFEGQGDHLQGACTICPVFRSFNVVFFLETRAP
jgi:signal transduction histidine kinase